jgi:T-complex protein 1 subunit eta
MISIIQIINVNLLFREWHGLLEKCAATAMSSKLIHSHKAFFKKLVVDAVLSLDDDLDESLIGMKTVPGGALQDTQLINGVAFKKTFSYAGFEQQPKEFVDPKVLCLNVELELKAERDNAEVRVEKVSVHSNLFRIYLILHD